MAADVSNEDSCKKASIWKQRLERAQAFVVENYLPLAFAVALTFALAYPVPGRFLVNIVVAGNVHIVQEVNMAIVFFLSGLALNTTELRTALRRESWPSVAFGGAMILLVTPALGFAMREIPLTPPAFSVGLTIFCLVPTTLGIGVALVRSCRGNEAIALLLTVGTNMVGVLTMPAYLKLLFLRADTGGLDLNIDIPDLLLKLTLTILVPSVIGKALRELFRPVEAFARAHRTALSLLSTTNLAFIVWQTLSGARDLLFQQRADMIVSVVVLSAAVHLFYLGVNHLIVKFLFHPPLPEHVAVVVMSSQKSAPVAVTVISYVTSLPAQQGLLAIPAVVGQLSQIFIGAVLAKRIAPMVTRDAKARAEAAVTAGAAAKAAPSPSFTAVTAVSSAVAAQAGKDVGKGHDRNLDPEAGAPEAAGKARLPKSASENNTFGYSHSRSYSCGAADTSETTTTTTASATAPADDGGSNNRLQPPGSSGRVLAAASAHAGAVAPSFPSLAPPAAAAAAVPDLVPVRVVVEPAWGAGAGGAGSEAAGSGQPSLPAPPR